MLLLDPQDKHAIILPQYNALVEGNSFILQNDHNPSPLYNQFINKLGKPFGRKYHTRIKVSFFFALLQIYKPEMLSPTI